MKAKVNAVLEAFKSVKDQKLAVKVGSVEFYPLPRQPGFVGFTYLMETNAIAWGTNQRFEVVGAPTLGGFLLSRSDTGLKRQAKKLAEELASYLE